MTYTKHHLKIEKIKPTILDICDFIANFSCILLFSITDILHSCSYDKDKFDFGKQNGAIHEFGFTEFVYHISFSIIYVNCAFLAVTDLHYCGKFYAVSLEISLSAKGQIDL